MPTQSMDEAEIVKAHGEKAGTSSLSSEHHIVLKDVPQTHLQEHNDEDKPSSRVAYKNQGQPRYFTSRALAASTTHVRALSEYLLLTWARDRAHDGLKLLNHPRKRVIPPFRNYERTQEPLDNKAQQKNTVNIHAQLLDAARQYLPGYKGLEVTLVFGRL